MPQSKGDSRSGNSIGTLLADAGKRHKDLMRIVESAPDDSSKSRIQRSAAKYARALSRYRNAVLELLTGFQSVNSGRPEVSPRRKCRDSRWQTKPDHTTLPRCIRRLS